LRQELRHRIEGEAPGDLDDLDDQVGFMIQPGA
jgi:hypothetical protein